MQLLKQKPYLPTDPIKKLSNNTKVLLGLCVSISIVATYVSIDPQSGLGLIGIAPLWLFAILIFFDDLIRGFKLLRSKHGFTTVQQRCIKQFLAYNVILFVTLVLFTSII